MKLVIERDKLYKARNGHIMRCLCVDNSGVAGRPVVLSSQRDGTLIRTDLSGKWDALATAGWDIVSEYREPQEVWVIRKPGTNEARGTWTSKQTALDMKNRFYPGCEVVKMREVMDE